MIDGENAIATQVNLGKLKKMIEDEAKSRLETKGLEFLSDHEWVNDCYTKTWPNVEDVSTADYSDFVPFGKPSCDAKMAYAFYQAVLYSNQGLPEDCIELVFHTALCALNSPEVKTKIQSEKMTKAFICLSYNVEKALRILNKLF